MEVKTLKVYEEEDVGEVFINEDVIAIIAGLAATEVEGVDSMGGGITNEIVSMLGMKSLSSGVNVSIAEGVVSVDITLVVKIGYSLPEVSSKVQEKVKTAIENMTGLVVDSVDVRITNVKVD